MDDKRKQSLLQVEALGAECGWVTPLTQDDRDLSHIFVLCSSDIILFRLKQPSWNTNL